MNINSKSARIAVAATSLAVAFWSAKAAAIGVAGGLDQSRPKALSTSPA